MASNKRQQILQTTLDLLAEKGFHGTAVAQVANDANVGMGTIYRYFKNKEALIHALYQEIKAELVAAMLANAEKNNTIRGRFVSIWRNLATYYLENPKALSFMEQFANSPYFMKLSEADRRELEYPIYQFVQQAQEQEVVKDAPIPILMTTVYGTIVALVKLHISGDYELDDAAIETATAVSWDAIKR